MTYAPRVRVTLLAGALALVGVISAFHAADARAFSCMDDCTSDPFKTEAQCEEECAGQDPGTPPAETPGSSGGDTGAGADAGGKEGSAGDAGAKEEPPPDIGDILPPASLIGGDGKVNRGNLNPIVKGYSTLRGAVGSFLAFILSFVGVVALLILVFQGYKYITGAGGGADSAKKAIANVVLGIILIIGAWALVVTVLNLGGGPGI